MNQRQQMYTLLAAIGTHLEGASIEQIKEALSFPIEHRTLQRRLKKLKEAGKIIVSGDKRSTRYHLPKATSESSDDHENEVIPLSDDAKEIMKIVSRPGAQRIPVGYFREFLEDYRPNIDSYLSDAEKNKLAKLGKMQGNVHPTGTYTIEVLNRLLIDLSWNSSRLEGNTYSLLDTELLIHTGKPSEDKSAMETQMILNHKDAIEFIVDPADEIGFNRYTVLNLHALLSNNLLPNPAASGRLREIGVGIGNSVFTPLGIPQLIEACFDLILEKSRQIDHPFEQSLFILIHLPYLQAFDDVNKRVSRLAANIPLIKNNLAPLSFIDVSEKYYVQGMLGIYELNRIELIKDVYLWAYERSALRYAAIRQSLGEPDPFRLRYREEIRSTLSKIILGKMGKQAASNAIKMEAGKLPEKDHLTFIEAVETEITNLHEGNFARYRIKPSEFKEWNLCWKL